ncbi:aspartate-semialdehyde dehydrogenase [Haemophilus influenzae]|nr:putative uSG1-like protein [Haemophilus influenzae]AVJ05601.1 putative uSG1-like protein [Haemophilus influenzae]KIP37539.1 hypothetical protein SU52_07160 [Haemophilus influenzae]KIP42349.1 hypothetical protein SU54_00625 [Haemophilus influenzae]KIP46756.1 hypothetical protein SU57_01085 [Haemophilus influenzae]
MLVILQHKENEVTLFLYISRIVIDVLGVCSALSDEPVVVPTVNESQLFELRQRNIVSLPDP